jgi:hypothetical protein
MEVMGGFMSAKRVVTLWSGPRDGVTDGGPHPASDCAPSVIGWKGRDVRARGEVEGRPTATHWKRQCRKPEREGMYREMCNLSGTDV